VNRSAIPPRVVVAAAQAAPIFLDRDATIAKACDLIAEAGRAGAALVAFPESFVPAYPDWVWSVPARDKKSLNALYAELLEQSVTVPSAQTERLSQAARRARVWVVIGVSERNAEASGTSLYNSLLFLDAEGRIAGCHRKLVPTGGERLVWAQGSGDTLRVHDTPFGRVGGLVCWENYMPLARFALYGMGEQIHVAATWDQGEPWLSTLRHVAKEGRMVVIGVSQALHRDAIPDRYAFKSLYAEGRAWINRGGSAIVDPEGRILAGPLFEKEEILYAEFAREDLTGGRWILDVAGHYSRPDVFEFGIRRPAVSAAPASDAVPSRSTARRAAKQRRAPPGPARAVRRRRA
jgi:nitrilase